MTDAAEVSDLLTRFRTRDRGALNRLVTLAARGEAVDLIRAELAATAREGEAPAEPRAKARVIALTGNSGVGKSSLIGGLIDVIRSRGETVAVLACDPESAITGGALLGDRVRMSAHAKDEGVWIRSLASASGRQAIADHLDLTAILLGRFGFDHVLLETVGAGQGDVAVEAVADVVVLLLQPEIGDELQWEKAGVLEVADVVVIHKGDLPGAINTETQVRELLNLPGCEEKPVFRVSSKSKAGIAELWSAIESRASHQGSAKRSARSLLRLTQERLAEHFTNHPEAVQFIVQQWEEGCLNDAAVADLLLARLIRPEGATTVGDPKSDVYGHLVQEQTSRGNAE